MSVIFKDIGTIWNREFDHRSFLNGEINFALNEFELKRGDREVDNLFKTIENITDIKDTEIDRFKQAVQTILPKSNSLLEEALEVSRSFPVVENKYKEKNHLEESRSQRKADWEHFMDYITASYSEIDSFSESKKQSLRLEYEQKKDKL